MVSSRRHIRSARKEQPGNDDGQEAVTTKSYHSSALPITAATICLVRVVSVSRVNPLRRPSAACAAGANNCSISRRTWTAWLDSSTATSAQRTDLAAATVGAISRYAPAPATRRRFSASLCRYELADHRVTAFTVEDFTGLQGCASRRDHVGAEPGRTTVGSLRKPTDATEMPTSRPIRCQRLYRQA